MTEGIAIADVELELVARFVFLLGAHGLLIERLDEPARIEMHARRGVVAAQHDVGASSSGLQRAFGDGAVGVADPVAPGRQLQSEDHALADYRVLLVIETVHPQYARIADLGEVPFLERRRAR